MTPRALTLSCTLGALALCSACSDPGTTERGPDKTPPPHLVEVTPAEHTLAGTSVERPGTLRYRRYVRIYTQEEGRILALPYFEGDEVKADDVLVRLEDQLLRADLAKAEATLAQARVDLERIQGLARNKLASEDERTRAATAVKVAEAERQLLSTRLAYAIIRAPFAGVVTARNAEPGDAVAVHTHLLTLADPGSLVTEVQASELVLPRLSDGDAVDVQIDALGGKSFPGRIQRIHPDIDPVTRQGKVEVLLEPIPPGARAGQFCRVMLSSAAVERLLIPFSALRRDSAGEFVYALDDQQQVRRRSVHSGLRIADRVEILSGLAEGEPVVVRGFIGLTEGDRVDPVER